MSSNEIGKFWRGSLWARGPIEINTAHRVLCFQLPHTWFENNAENLLEVKTSQDNKNNVLKSMMLAFFELFTRANNAARSDTSLNENSMSLYIEIIPAIETREEQEYRTKINPIPTVEELGSQTLWEYVTRWPRGRPVGEVRFWVVIQNDKLDLAKILLEMMEVAHKRLAPYVDASRFSKTSEDPLVRAKTHMLSAQVLAGLDLKPHQEWMKVLWDMASWQSAVGLYTHNKCLIENTTVANIPLQNDDNPLNPINVFMILHINISCDKERKVHPKYRSIANYIKFAQVSNVNSVNARFGSNDEDYSLFGESSNNDAANIAPATNSAARARTFMFCEWQNVMGPVPFAEIAPSNVVNRYHFNAQFGLRFTDWVTLCKVMKSKAEPKIQLITRNQLDQFDNPEPAEKDDDISHLFMSEDDAEGSSSNTNVQDGSGIQECSVTEVSEAQKNEIHNAWVQMAEWLNISKAAIPKRVTYDTEFLLGKDLRTPGQVFANDGEYVGVSTDPIAQLRIKSQRAWGDHEKIVNQQMEEYYQKYKKRQQGDGIQMFSNRDQNVHEDFPAEVYDQDHEHFLSFLASLKKKRLRTEYNAHRHSYAKMFANLIRRDASLQGADVHYAGFGEKLMGVPLAKSSNFSINYYDPDLSVFGHFYASLNSLLDEVELASFAHKLVMEGFFSRFSCLQRRFGLLLHILVYGKESGSKSWFVTMLELMSITGTSTPVQDQSRQAGSTDTHQNYICALSHEFQTSVYNTHGTRGKGLSEEAERRLAQLKEAMVQCLSVYRVFQNGIGGDRQYRDVRTEKHVCYFAATNGNPMYMDPALQSRLHIVGVNPTWSIYRDNKTLDAVTAAKLNEPRYLKEKSSNFRHFGKVLQFLHWAVERLIEMGCLIEPSLHAIDDVLNRVTKYLKNHNKSTGTSRTRERIRVMTRILCISSAIAKLFFMQDSKYKDTPFQIELLLDLDQYLVATEEMAVTALSFYEDAFQDPAEEDVLIVLQKMHENQMQRVNDRIESFNYVELQGVERNVAELGMGIGIHDDATDVDSEAHDTGRIFDSIRALTSTNVAPAPNRHPVEPTASTANLSELRQSTNTMNVEDACMLAEGDSRLALNATEQQKVAVRRYNWSEAVFLTDKRTLALQIAAFMQNEKNNCQRKLSVDIILNVLYRLSKTVTPLYRYTLPPPATAFHALTGVVRPKSIITSQVQTDMAVFFGERTVRVHYSLLENARRVILGRDSKSKFKNQFLGNKADMNDLAAAILATQNRFTVRRKIITSQTNSELPMFVNCLQLEPDESQYPIEYVNPYFMTPGARLISSTSANSGKELEKLETTVFLNNRQVVIYNCSTDVQAMKERLSAMHYTVSSKDVVEALIPSTSERYSIKKYFDTHPFHPKINYPTQVIEEYKQCHAALTSASTREIICPVRQRGVENSLREMEELAKDLDIPVDIIRANIEKREEGYDSEDEIIHIPASEVDYTYLHPEEIDQTVVSEHSHMSRDMHSIPHRRTRDPSGSAASIQQSKRARMDECSSSTDNNDTNTNFMHFSDENSMPYFDL